MAKKTVPGTRQAKVTTATIPVTNSPSSFARENLGRIIISIAYLLIHFIPNLDAYDAMGPQWLYIVLVDLGAIAYLLVNRQQYEYAARHVFGNLFSKLYLAFFLLAGVSVLAAINKTEFWVCYVRLIATVIAFFNLGILFHNRVDFIKWLAQVIALVLLAESLMATLQFLKDYSEMAMSTAILNIKGTTGNKNIFSAGLVVKIPFVLYCMHDAKTLKRLFNSIILAVGALTILLANARAAYLSLFIISILYVVFCILENRKKKNTELVISRIGFAMVAIVIGLVISQLILANVQALQDSSSQTYGSLTHRLGSINTSGSDNLIRLQLWEHAIDYTKHHPLMGCGYGNWKLASIPYIRVMTNDLFVPIHSHNDFLETFAELGILGGLLFLSLFVCITVFTIKTYFSNADQETKLAAVFSLLALVGYSVDAFFNFPVERPINQVFFVLITAINISAYMRARQAEETEETKSSGGVLNSLFGLASILLLIPSAYITYQTYRSLIIQRQIMQDIEHEPLQLKYQEIFPKIPSIPNLTATAQPLDAIKGRYLSEAGKYQEALALLNKSIADNPFIGYSEFIKSTTYFRMEKYDSARVNAEKAFYTRPKANTYYQTYIAILAKLKDTAAIQKAFDEYDRYRPSVFSRDMYLRAMLQAKGRGTQQLLAFADSSIRRFADDPGVSALQLRRQEVVSNMNVPAGVNAAEQLNRANALYTAGVAAFTKGKAGTPPGNRKDYQEAADNFRKAGEVITNNYVIYENAGIAYFNMQEYNRAIQYFDKSIGLNTSTDGKSEYFKGVSLYNLGRKNEGCDFIRKASNKGYAEANVILQNNCK